MNSIEERQNNLTQPVDFLLKGLSPQEGQAPRPLTSLDPNFMSADKGKLTTSLNQQVSRLGDYPNTSSNIFSLSVDFAERWFDEPRFDGTPNPNHSLRIKLRLLEDPIFLTRPEDLAVKLPTAGLHDLAEDTNVTLTEIENHFGRKVRDGVDALSRVIRATGQRRTDEEYYENLYQQPDYIKDIKGHDRVDNLEALTRLNLNSPDRYKMIEEGLIYLSETQRFYHPLVSNNSFLLSRIKQAYHAASTFYAQAERFVA